MDDSKFESFINFFDIAFREVAREMAEVNLMRCSQIKLPGEKRFSIIIGITGENKGRILFETNGDVVKRITEGMNEGPFDNTINMYLFLAEFTNIFCGNAISFINNKYENSELRLTPPAIFSGTEMKIISPSIQTESVFYTCDFGYAILDIGFEGE